MLLEQIAGYELPTLGLWPHYSPQFDCWMMHAYKLKKNGSLAWYKYFIEGGNDWVKPELYSDLKEAESVARDRNPALLLNIDSLAVKDEVRLSLRLKVDKALKSRDRLIEEELLMLEVAKEKHSKAERPSIHSLVLSEKHEHLRGELHSQLQEMPYLQIARVKHTILARKGESDWSTELYKYTKSEQACYRERIARGFGYCGTAHWGKTKAAIRAELLPRANELLAKASVKRMLDEALRDGRKVIVAGGFVFWYEANEKVGWIVKEANYSDSKKANIALWAEGTIVSKNHGRIVVLPYIKENGELVQGHTKNAPNDGKATPRDPREYLELPFDILRGDYMRTLFGELQYE
ncbi:hypothetical protein [Aliamphritea hakodatensis]|uniref:hypothetical protein n=1 Tax=Aliamphritea hakodatensis TaxID=2895352 RepID=UPI0022FD9888|nr:hypothetical protein [Aliamphritea hakodatensis]